MQSHPTAYADINAFLDLLLSQTQLTLGNKLVGLYISGSLAKQCDLWTPCSIGVRGHD
jgi:hypothetical protein